MMSVDKSPIRNVIRSRRVQHLRPVKIILPELLQQRSACEDIRSARSFDLPCGKVRCSLSKRSDVAARYGS